MYEKYNFVVFYRDLDNKANIYRPVAEAQDGNMDLPLHLLLVSWKASEVEWLRNIPGRFLQHSPSKLAGFL